MYSMEVFEIVPRNRIKFIPKHRLPRGSNYSRGARDSKIGKKWPESSWKVAEF